MASFTVEGLDEAINGLQKMDLFDGETQEELLCDAGDTLVNLIRTEMSKSRLRLDDMTQKVTYSKKIKTDKNGVPSITVTASGKTAQGQRNATVLFVLNYGRDKKYGQITGGYFWTIAVQKAKGIIPARLQKIAEKKLKERGLI